MIAKAKWVNKTYVSSNGGVRMPLSVEGQGVPFLFYEG